LTEIVPSPSICRILSFSLTSGALLSSQVTYVDACPGIAWVGPWAYYTPVVLLCQFGASGVCVVAICAGTGND
jgi:hypothetical protein